MKNGDKGAFTNAYRYGSEIRVQDGLTKREYACIKNGVADTGCDKLDEIIRTGNRMKIAAMAMQGFMIGQEYKHHKSPEDIAKASVLQADALLKALEDDPSM